MTAKRDERYAAVGGKDGKGEIMLKNGKEVEEKEGGEEGVQLDEALYSRQLYVMGQEASRRMAAASVLLCGLGGLGVEIAKNIILMGVKSVTLHDTKKVTLHDLSTQFYLREKEEGRGRADACVGRLQDLNPNVKVKVASGPLSLHLVARHAAVVLTDSPLEEQLRVSKWCREAGGAALVVAGARGLCGQIFCDFGENFKVLEPKARELARFPVAAVTNEEEGLVTLPAKTFHGLQDGDLVVFSDVRGMTQLNGPRPHIVKVESGNSFRVGDTRQMGRYQGGGVCQEVLRPLSLTFTPLPEALDHANIVAADGMKEREALVLHVAFLALHEYEECHGHPPRPWHVNDANKFLEIFRNVNEQRQRKAEEDIHLVQTFAYTAGAQTAPLISVVGGVAAQEVAKACSAKFPPLQQWLYLDALECLPQDTSELLAEEGAAVPADRYSAQVALFGRRFQERLGDLRYFIVGAGAIGCELLKNLALAGVGAGTQGAGGLTITDMDMIEKSNLSRQFLFRTSDMTRSKSETAAAAAMAINPTLRVTAHQLRVSPETEHVFNASFYESLNGVALAVDNVEARRYMDHACWLHRRPMLECGTLGLNGSVQPILPGLTERYTQEQVSEDRPVAVCTLKRFPTTIQHTLQWARDVFEGEFTAVPEAAMKYLSGGGGPPDSDMKVSLRQALIEEVPQCFKDCVSWARCLWQVLYHDAILDLLEEFPPNKVTSSGTPFWSHDKRQPRPLHFQPEDPLHLAFIRAAANLRAAVYGLQQVRNEATIHELVQNLETPPRSHRQSALGRERTEQEEGKEEQDINDLPHPDSLPHLCLLPLTFEKDDDDNFHIDFITAASNLRASNYKITPVDHATSKRIAGRIIPAIVTSTAVAAGLVVLELFKVAQEHTHLDVYRTTEFNLALCRFCMAEPAPADDLSGRWNKEEDQLEVEGELTMAQFLTLFHDVHQLEVTLVAAGNLTLHSFLLPKTEKAKRSAMTISAILEEVGGENWGKAGPVVMLELGAEDLEGEEVEVPPVRYFVRKEEADLG